MPPRSACSVRSSASRRTSAGASPHGETSTIGGRRRPAPAVAWLPAAEVFRQFQYLTVPLVSLKRKQQAIRAVGQLATDAAGNPAPFADTTAYERASVAVPFGNCTEPSNVKAGGGSCPIRFQCAGCGFYRPDPSYLPAIEQHVTGGNHCPGGLPVGAQAGTPPGQWMPPVTCWPPSPPR